MLWMLSRRARERRCGETRALMSDYLEGELDQAQATKVERHLRWCRNCGRVLGNLSATVQGLRRLGDQPSPPEHDHG